MVDKMKNKTDIIISTTEVKLGKAGKSFKIIRCPNCNSEIAIDEHTIYPIDCSCGCAIAIKIYKNGKYAMEYNPVNEHEWGK